MKFQFTTEGSKSQTKYHHVRIYNSDMSENLFECIVSTPLPAIPLAEYLRSLLDAQKYGLELSIRETYPELPTIHQCGFMCVKPVGLDTIARIITNIKPLKQKVIISICGEKKAYELDADKLETLLKSLE